MKLIEQIENGWPEDQIVNVDAAAVSLIPTLRRLKENGAEFRWVQTHRLRELELNGWLPVVDSQNGHEVIYKNRLPTQVRAAQDLILVMRESTESVILSTFNAPT